MGFKKGVCITCAVMMLGSIGVSSSISAYAKEEVKSKIVEQEWSGRPEELRKSLKESIKNKVESDIIIEKQEEERKRKIAEAKKRAEEERKRKEAEAKKKAEAERKAREEAERERLKAEEAKKKAQQIGVKNTQNNYQKSTNNAAYGHADKSIFTWPVPGFYNITYGVGYRWGAYHKGIDISSGGIRGAKICAAADGVVVTVSNNCSHDYGKNGSCGCGGGYGNYCVVQHANGYTTLYGHSEGIIVKVGQQVKKGDILGTVGSTGFSTGEHLHFEISKNGVIQNPQDYV